MERIKIIYMPLAKILFILNTMAQLPLSIHTRLQGHKIFVILLLSLSIIWGQKRPASSKTNTSTVASAPIMAILDWVDLGTEQNLPQLTERFRTSILSRADWNSISRTEMESQLRSYDRSMEQPCRSSGCAYELVSFLNAPYVIFASAARYQNSAFFQIRLMSMENSRIVWSKLATCPNDPVLIRELLEQVAQSIPSPRLLQKLPSETGQLVILTNGKENLVSQILYDRMLTQLSGIPTINVFSQQETDDLLKIIEVKPTSLDSEAFNLPKWGQQMGVEYVVYMDFRSSGLYPKIHLGFFDVRKKRWEWNLPPSPRSELPDLLHGEMAFTTALKNYLTKP